jgi:hypothetical protein
MNDQNSLFTLPLKNQPWNKGKVTGAKPPLRPKHVWSIRSKLQAETKRATLRCSTWPSIASYVPAMSLH